MPLINSTISGRFVLPSNRRVSTLYSSVTWYVLFSWFSQSIYLRSWLVLCPSIFVVKLIPKVSRSKISSLVLISPSNGIFFNLLIAFVISVSSNLICRTLVFYVINFFLIALLKYPPVEHFECYFYDYLMLLLVRDMSIPYFVKAGGQEFVIFHLL